MDVVSYIRVSTQKQGVSGLGLEAQQATVEYFLKHGHQHLHQYQEVESGRNCDRPELAKALQHCRSTGATLIVAKLDRLARNVVFLATLMESNVAFIALDNPTANKLTLHILASMAEAESEAISTRTKEAMAQYKLRGGKLGCRPDGSDCMTLAQRKQGARISGAIQHARAVKEYAPVVSDVARMRKARMTLQQIADRLNLAGYATRRGRQWCPTIVSRVLDMATVENYPLLTV